MTDFQQFMRGLASDARLGPLFRGDLAKQSAEVVILNLATRLADAFEGRQPHPALALLDELDRAEVQR